MPETIDHTALSHLIQAGAQCQARAVGQPGGWTVTVRYGIHERPLAAQRSRQIRVFRRFETLASYLKDIGLPQFDVDATRYAQSDTTGTKRPDRSEALKKAHEAAAYDAWFREQVQASVDDPRPSIPHEQVKAKLAAKAQALRKQLGRNDLNCIGPAGLPAHGNL